MRYYLSLGSNLGDRRRHLRRGLDALERAGLRVDRVSSVYRTQPVDLAAQPWFFNLAARLVTGLRPDEVLDIIHGIEAGEGRVRTRRSGPRTLDIDILLAGAAVIRTPRLTIPHPRLETRNFVLVPLAEIAPGAVHPSLGKRIATLLEASTDNSVVKRLGPLARDSRG